MKKTVLALSLLLAVGGGCVGLGKGGHKVVEGDWYLAFDLPSGWIMADEYQTPKVLVVIPDQTVDKNDNIIFLQTSPKAIVSDGSTPAEAVPADTYITSGYTQIKVSRLDSHRVIPSESEDLGQGFFRDSEDANVLYLKTETEKYEFEILGDNKTQAEDIVQSAEVVTAVEAAQE